MKKFYLLPLCLCLFNLAQAQVFKMQYSFEAHSDFLFFRYDPRENVPMSNYVGSIQDWTQLLTDKQLNEEEIYVRLDPKFMMIQPRLAANVNLISNHIRVTGGISTGRYEFRNLGWNMEAMFTYKLHEDYAPFTFETGFMMFQDYSFGPEAAIRSAKDTPKSIKTKMYAFMTEKLFEKPTSKGVKFGVYYNLFSCFDLGASYFLDFVKRSDHARNDYGSLSIRVRLQD